VLLSSLGQFQTLAIYTMQLACLGQTSSAHVMGHQASAEEHDVTKGSYI